MVDGDTMKNKIKGTIYLLLATVIWGSAFIAQSVGMDHVGPAPGRTSGAEMAGH